MATSNPASDQELAEKQRRELAASTFWAAFVERYRRKLEASKFLIKLEGPLNTTEAVAQAAGIPSPNGDAISATDSSGKVGSFLEINAVNKIAIESYLRAKPSLNTFVPTFILCNPARKDLSPISLHPTLGIESTLPHRRLQHLHDEPRPAQDEYPVWYFVYGDLAEEDILLELLGCEPRLQVKVQAFGGLLRRRGQSWAVINDPDGERCMPWMALLVETKAQEDMLRVYQTDAYEVVRCPIGLRSEEGLIAGLTFRFIE
ncbi:hypothetical protein FPANT_10764 [Fusarium pseudoanthophilum]|uniref:Gamma-glutamylcyclotransferase AIG2-like domain-containing protein n=1 Tax=Fusarium pseudoanthophilum TaxID=48495 RepID=A0A8H5NV09_9HYPO|nr:hypothetical protein FPANT_10764 [Fusarium pseudoanthophilum]